MADGRVTDDIFSDPVLTWIITELDFVTAAPKSARIVVAFLRRSGATAAQQRFEISDELAYQSLIAAIATPSGADEALMVGPDGLPLYEAVLRLRVARWLVSTSRMTGVTAEYIS